MNRHLSAPFFQSRIRSDEVQRKEKVLGYFLGPCLTYMAYTALAGTYLMQFYTDVLGLAGAFLTWMPFISKLLSGAIGLLIGQMIDRTRSAQGKARPWILLSGALLAVCGFLLYAVPKSSYAVQLAWVIVSYNLFFGLAFNLYSLSHSLMVPLSTDDSKQRDRLAMLTSMATSLLPGMLTTIIMPLLVSFIGVGNGARGAWLSVMGILSVLAIPATLLEYYFTRERISNRVQAQKVASLHAQMKACIRNRFWLLIMLFTLTINLCSNLSNGVMLYYCNWVLGNSIASGASKQVLVNMVGQAPLGLGILILWPLVKKLGKRRVTVSGFLIAALGSLVVYLAGTQTPLVLVGLLIRSFGTLPTYLMASYLADALNSVAQSNGFRADGFSASVSSLLQTLSMGLGQTLLLAGIERFGYLAPASSTQIIVQSEAIVHFFRACFSAIPLFGYLICAVLILFCRENAQNAK